VAAEVDQAKRSLHQVKDLSHSAQALLPEILRRWAAGMSKKQIARDLDLTASSVRRAILRATEPQLNVEGLCERRGAT
jgi:DNA-binding NarL/FixJ family response regulator